VKPIELLAAMLTELAEGRATVRPDTRIGYLGEIGLDALDLVLATVAFEISYCVDIPNEYLAQRDWTVARLAEESLRLTKTDDPLFPLRKVLMLARAFERATRDHDEEGAAS